jgi:hypothetical protein
MTEQPGVTGADPASPISTPTTTDDAASMESADPPAAAAQVADHSLRWSPEPGGMTAASATEQANPATGSSSAALLAAGMGAGQTARSNQSDSWARPSEGPQQEGRQSGYVAAAALAATSQVSIGTAGLVAHHISGPVSVAPQTRVRDVLNGGTVDRRAIQNDRSYVQAREWNLAWEEAVRVLPENRVIIVVAPRGYGSTTFSLRLLACQVDERAELIRLEADWQSPVVGKLPIERDHAYQLDLKDPSRDQFDGAFLNGLREQSSSLKALGSYLFLTVAAELWSGHDRQIPAGVGMLRLNAPPDAIQIVERHLVSRDLGFLGPYVRQHESAKHVQGRNAVQALQAVEKVVRQWEAHKHNPSNTVPADVGILPAEETSPEPRLAGPELDPHLVKEIEQALGDWEDDLNKYFGDPRLGLDNSCLLSPEDRCLLMSLAMHQTGTAAEIEAAALTLEYTLGKDRRESGSQADEAWRVFSRPGLRPRLGAFDASIDERDRVNFDRPGYAEAVLAYVWGNYSGLRDALIAWMVQCATAGSQVEDPAVKTLAALILRLQDTDLLASLRDLAVSQNRQNVIVRVMVAAAADEHMGRRAWNLLYDWASQRPEYQQVVIAVCQELIDVKEDMAVKKDMAMVRLRRVANKTADTGIRAQILAVLRGVAADPDSTARFTDVVAAWQKADPASHAAKLSLLALLGTEVDGIPWIPSRTTTIDVARGMREILTDLSAVPDVVPTFARWLKSCARDNATYEMARSLWTEATRDRHAFNAGIFVMKELADARKPDGTSVGDDITNATVHPGLRSHSPLAQPEI